jgi:hypothetical protein
MFLYKYNNKSNLVPLLLSNPPSNHKKPRFDNVPEAWNITGTLGPKMEH